MMRRGKPSGRVAEIRVLAAGTAQGGVIARAIGVSNSPVSRGDKTLNR